MLQLDRKNQVTFMKCHVRLYFIKILSETVANLDVGKSLIFIRKPKQTSHYLLCTRFQLCINV